MSDIVERAEAALACDTQQCGWRPFVVELVAELKAARATEERHLHEIFHLQDDLKAARAQPDRLKNPPRATKAAS